MLLYALRPYQFYSFFLTFSLLLFLILSLIVISIALTFLFIFDFITYTNYSKLPNYCRICLYLFLDYDFIV